MNQTSKSNRGYPVPLSPIALTLEVKKSRFIAHIAQASSADEAKRFLESIKEKHPDATHHCWAFQTERPGSTRSIGCSDDGEPSGTAGKPMLTVLTHAKIGELVAVVTRYYGGTKLGTGGLARAYAQSVKNALAELKCCQKVNWHYGALKFDYGLKSQVEGILKAHGAEIIEQQFQDDVLLNIRYGFEDKKALNQQLGNISQGKLTIQ